MTKRRITAIIIAAAAALGLGAGSGAILSSGVHITADAGTHYFG